MSQTILLGNRYRIVASLGEGGMGKVYRVVDQLNGTTVALKQLTSRLSEMQDMVDFSLTWLRDIQYTITQEFKVLASLRHPNIISVLDYGFDDQRQPYFTLELLENAQPFVKYAGKLPLKQQVDLIVQMLEALAYLHRRGIIHRDIKPDNVMIVGGQVKVLDFGLAAVREQIRTDKGVAGTVAYMAPELLQEFPASVASDLYAVGVLLYELISKQQPFVAKSGLSRLVQDIIAHLPDAALLGNHPLSRVVLRLLHKDPLQRYANANEVIRAVCQATQKPLPPESSAIRESYLQAAQFVGRESELTQLQSALNDCISGQGSLWLVGGESGVGKSRLLEELRVQALISGVQVVRGQGIAEGGLSYQLWREPLRRMVLSAADYLTDLDVSVLATVIPDISPLLNRPLLPVAELSRADEQQRLIFTIITLFRLTSQPLLVILEDLQWVQESKAVLKGVSNTLADQRILIVGSYRSDEAPNLPSEFSNAHSLLLGRLSEDAIRNLCVSMLGENGENPEVVALLHQETEGNAFFLVEITRALAEEAGALDAIGDKPLPERIFTGGINALLQRRLERVAPEHLPLLKIAAVAGRELDLKMLQAVAAHDSLDTWLTACADAALLDIEDNRWRFFHDKLREWLLASVTDAELPSLHQTVALALETCYGAENAYALRLTEHWRQAKQMDKALDYAQLAAPRMWDVANYRDLVKMGEWALPEIEQRHDFKYLQIVKSIADGYLSLGRHEQAMAFYDQLISNPATDSSIVVASMSGRGNICWQLGNYDEAVRTYERALQLATDHHDAIGVVRANQGLGVVKTIQGKFLEGRTFTQTSIEQARQLGHLYGIVTGLNNLATNYYGNKEEADQALACLKEAYDICHQTGNVRMAGTVLHNMGYDQMGRQAYKAAESYFLDSLKISRVLGYRYGVCATCCELGFSYVLQDQFDLAIQTLDEGVRLGLELHAVPQILDMIPAYAEVLRRFGKPDISAVLLGFVEVNPSTMADTLTARTPPLRAALESELDAATLAYALEQGRGLSLEVALEQIKHALSNLVFLS